MRDGLLCGQVQQNIQKSEHENYIYQYVQRKERRTVTKDVAELSSQRDPCELFRAVCSTQTKIKTPKRNE